MKMLSNRTGGFLPALILAVMLVFGFSAQRAQAQDYYDDYGNGSNNGNYQEFYDDLAPYGQWMNDPQYGYVWSPNVGNDFRPYYTNGQWAMTEYGNTWVSDYNWGWAPFHYGRWAQGSYGWIWIPGNTWGPAWVDWRQGGGYYGWAPMGPGVSINVSFGGGYNVPNPWWTFIPCGNIYTPGWQRYYSPRRTVNIINNTTIINNTYVDNRTRNTYVTGPRRNEIEAATRQKVTVYNVNNRTRSGATNLSGRSVNVYRPSLAASGRGQVNAAPREAKTLQRTAVTNTGGGRAPSRVNGTPVNNSNDRSGQLRNQQSSRDITEQRNAVQQQQVQQRNTQLQRDQQVQQQRVQRAPQLQQQRVQQQNNVQMQQVQQQRAQRDQQLQQQDVQRQQQMQQQQVQRQQVQPQQNMQRQQVQPQQNMQRQAQPQPQRVERSAPARQERSTERAAPRGR